MSIQYARRLVLGRLVVHIRGEEQMHDTDKMWYTLANDVTAYTTQRRESTAQKTPATDENLIPTDDDQVFD